jgi:hypothetical protein
MRLRNRKSRLILLLLPSLAAAAAALADSQSVSESTASTKKIVSGTKAAPVDGKDGKPHAGPFVGLDNSDTSTKQLPALKHRPADPTIVDGKRIPESNDGVMDDKNRPGPKKGTTGTEGGVSEKNKEKKLKEQAGEKVENKPQTPKEAPHLPHSDEEKVLSDGQGKHGDYSADYSADQVSGLEVRLRTNFCPVNATANPFYRNQPTFLARRMISPLQSRSPWPISIISMSRRAKSRERRPNSRAKGAKASSNRSTRLCSLSQ